MVTGVRDGTIQVMCLFCDLIEFLLYTITF